MKDAGAWQTPLFAVFCHKHRRGGACPSRQYKISTNSNVRRNRSILRNRRTFYHIGTFPRAGGASPSPTIRKHRVCHCQRLIQHSSAAVDWGTDIITQLVPLGGCVTLPSFAIPNLPHFISFSAKERIATPDVRTGDSSPRGGAKSCLSLWERWHGACPPAP